MWTQGDAFDGSLWFFSADDAPKAHELARNPQVGLSYAAPDKDVTDAALRQAVAADWFFRVSDLYPLYELLIEHVLLGERASPDDWPPRYRSWRSAGARVAAQTDPVATDPPL